MPYNNFVVGYCVPSVPEKKDPVLLLWRSLIRSRLEYCCQLWCPTQTGDIQSLEQVQRNRLMAHSICHIGSSCRSYPCTLWSEEENIIYCYKYGRSLRENPNIESPDHAGIKAAWHLSRGRSCAVPGGKFVHSKALSKPKIFKFWSCGAKTV